MTGGDERRLGELLELALDLPTRERRAVLEEAEADSSRVDEVLRLLDDEDADDTFLAGPAFQRLSDERAEPLADEPLPEFPGYTVERRLGEGGMGEVFLATEDGSETRRRVAIKRIRTFGDLARLLPRFAFERDALARLNHPSVAQLFGAGTGPDGRPYVVMEHVEGLPVTAFCDRERLSVDERLRLFLDVCRGVEHAHRRQLLHRDLKPSNILVTRRDDEATPKIIDFGIARALDTAPGTGGSTGTSVLGTPAYMSPEALGTGDGPHDLDTRTDVFSLGVVLYQLLVGVRPFDDDTTSDPVLLLNRIAHDEPPRPSTRWRTLTEEGRTAGAAARRLDPAEVAGVLAGDLDWIVSKAIAPDRDRRYGSVAALAADIERHLRLEPVEAGPPSWSYRAGRFVRRNRLVVALASIALVALAVGIAGTTAGMLRAREALRQEAAAREEAQATADFLKRIFLSSAVNRQDAERAPSEITARELLDEGARRIGEELEDRPRVSAQLRYTLGDTYNNLGLYEEAHELLEQALDDLSSSDEPPSDPRLPSLIELELGLVSETLTRYDEALGHFSRAEELAAGFHPAEEIRFLASVWTGTASVLTRRAEFERAEELQRRAIALLRSASEVDEDALLSITSNLGGVFFDQERWAEAEAEHAKALEIAQRILPPGHVRTARLTDSLAAAIASQGRLDEAAPLFAEALEARRAILPADHPDLAISLNNLAHLNLERGRPDDAERYHREALAIRRQAFGDEHPTTAWSYQGLGEVAAQRKRWDEAKEWMLGALHARRTALGDRHPAVAFSLSRLGSLARERGDLEEAEARSRAALAIRRAQDRTPYPRRAEAALDLAELLAERDTSDEVPDLLEEAEEHLPEVAQEAAPLRARIESLRLASPVAPDPSVGSD